MQEEGSLVDVPRVDAAVSEEMVTLSRTALAACMDQVARRTVEELGQQQAELAALNVEFLAQRDKLVGQRDDAMDRLESCMLQLRALREELAEKETELAKAAASRDVVMRMLESYKVENKVLLAKCEELAVRCTAGSEEESEEEEADVEEEAAWHPGACTLCCGEFADTKEQALCVDGCGAMAHIACIKSKVNLGPNREYVALRGGWHVRGGGYVCPCCW